ncbi:MAG: leucyl aminopeptidase [Burkholderiaceae bacterium]
MDFSSKLASPESIKTGALAVGVYADGTLTAAARAIDAASQGALKALVKSGDVSGKRGSAVVMRDVAGVAATRVVLVGLGKAAEFNDQAYLDAVRAAVKATPAAKDIALAATEWAPKDRDSEWLARQLVLATREAFFRVDELKSQKDEQPEPAKVVLLLAAKEAAADRGLKQGTAIANGMELTKRLANLPPNICTPSYLADTARQIAKQFKLRAEVLEQKQMEALKMGSLLSVAKGSTQAPKLIVLKYQGAAAKAAPVVLVGKGITFDSGGISLKPGAGMDEMKYDMGGAASVLGTMRAVAELGLKINLVAVVPACENMPSGGASKPGDIVTSMSGQTIEILNTDAEGRLILCDALTYAERFKPAAVIDVATLTGACVVALGNVNSGLFSADETLAAQLSAAARDALDPAWRMPLDEAYQDQLKSNFADMANIGSPANAGAITAASFLARFTKAYPWAHLDIAGTAWKSGAAKGATGRPVGLLTRFLMERA